MREGDLPRDDRIVVRDVGLRVVASVLELDVHSGSELLEIEAVPIDADCVADPPRLLRRRSAVLGHQRQSMSNTSGMPVDALRMMGADVETALEHVNVPSYVIDRAGVVRWMNPAAQELVGDRAGQQFTSVVAPEETRRARELFARKVLGNTEVTDASVTVVDLDGTRVGVEISSVPLRRGEHVVGVFGQVSDVLEEPHAHPDLNLTPRQAEVLQLLERGRSTTQIAEELHVSRETVRNHVRHLLHALGASSRLEAVAVARGH